MRIALGGVFALGFFILACHRAVVVKAEGDVGPVVEDTAKLVAYREDTAGVAVDFKDTALVAVSRSDARSFTSSLT
jgi:hypothetical protein